MFGRLLGRAWGGDPMSRIVVVAGLLLGGWLLYATHGISRPVVPAKPSDFQVHDAQPAPRQTVAATPPRPAPVAAPQYFTPPAPAYSVPAYAYPAGAGYRPNYYARYFPAAPMMQPMWARQYAFAGRGFGFGHGSGGVGHGGRR
jgi:hypothetical protein